ncbi:MAG: motility associated factor glycosyltransferase family protein [Phycisphaerales bacterium]
MNLPTSTTIPTSSCAGVLERNLAHLGRFTPKVVEAIRSGFARMDLEWIQTPTGRPSATTTDWDAAGMPVTRALASKRDPMGEAEKLTQNVDVKQHAAVVVMGFGLGYHVEQIARRMKRTGIVVVFEPDVGLLRSVLERIDHSDWLSACNIAILTDPFDAAAMAELTGGKEELFALGLKIVEHPASKPRIGPSGPEFIRNFTRLMEAVRTTVVTTMVQTEATLRNATQNLDHYCAGPGIADLAGRYAGRPAIVVAAGPSLQRNIELLTDPAVRERFVIVAVQTVLKPLLERGIQPHFVTALDYHEISRRFYEGLSAEDVRGVTLVVEPKVNPAVTSAFPGVVRCASDHFLDAVLGDDLVRPMGQIEAGATVAHLAYYLARYLGCEPVALIGQDLGFTDGQYYAAGAAIHSVWAGELNPFNTLEMLEWQRIVRMRGLLRPAMDVLGRKIYTDEQMAAYLVQFQRAFTADMARGLTTIDATEGGVAKQGTTTRTLAEFIKQHRGGPAITPDEPVVFAPAERRRRLRAASERVRELRRDLWRVGKLSRDAAMVLTEMLEHQRDQIRVNGLIGKVEKLRDEVMALTPAFGMVQRLNQTGAFRRARADRAMYVGDNVEGMDLQKRQIERDLSNVRSLADAADVMGDILDQSAAILAGGPKRTRDPLEKTKSAAPVDADGIEAPTITVAAVAVFNPAYTGLGTTAYPAAEIAPGRTALNLTLHRLARVKELRAVAVVCPDVAEAKRFAGQLPANVRFEFVQAPVQALPPATARAGRLWARDGWRGGLCNLTCYDEALDPGAVLAGLEATGAGAALVCGGDWCFVDPAIASQLIARYHEDEKAHRLTFTQAAPGLAPCLVDAAVLRDLAANRTTAGGFASIGGLLGYVPTSPMSDLIAKSNCVPVTPTVRDARIRCIPDSPWRAALLRSALETGGMDALTATAEQIAAAVSSAAEAIPSAPWHAELHADGSGALSETEVDRVCRGLAARHTDAAVTFTGRPLDHPALPALIAAARRAGVAAAHVRTDLVATTEAVDRLLAATPEIISIDLHANDPETYAAVAPHHEPGAFARSRENLQRLINARHEAGAGGLMDTPWLVPRITRRDEVYEQIEYLYDHWLLTAGACVIDPLAQAMPGARIAPLPLPALARWRNERGTVSK